MGAGSTIAKSRPKLMKSYFWGKEGKKKLVCVFAPFCEVQK
jgi:hypothetical protein